MVLKRNGLFISSREGDRSEFPLYIKLLKSTNYKVMLSILPAKFYLTCINLASNQSRLRKNAVFLLPAKINSVFCIFCICV